jgi:hypothetical protein
MCSAGEKDQPLKTSAPYWLEKTITAFAMISKTLAGFPTDYG